MDLLADEGEPGAQFDQELADVIEQAAFEFPLDGEVELEFRGRLLQVRELTERPAPPQRSRPTLVQRLAARQGFHVPGPTHPWRGPARPAAAATAGGPGPASEVFDTMASNGCYTMGIFAANLPNIPKQARKAAVVEHLQMHLKQGGSDEDARAMVLEVARLGRKWTGWVLHLAQDRSMPPEVQRVIENVAGVLAAEQYTREIVVAEKGTGLSRGEVEGLLDGLENLQNTRGHCHLRVVFDTSQVYVYGLCAIAAWAYQNAVEVEFDCHQSRVEHFLTRAGFFEALRDPDSEPVRFDTETILGFTRIDPATRFETDAHAGRLVDLFRKHIGLPESTARALAISFAELIENAVKHGRIARPAWLFANYHPQPKIMHICVCDRGIGIQQSFLESENPAMRD